jgi:hypothetical protein
MGCGCNTKNAKKADALAPIEFSKIDFLDIIVKIFTKTVGFSLAVLTMPIISAFVLFFMFEMLVLNKQVDLKKLVTGVSSKLSFMNESFDPFDNEDDDEEEIDDDDEEFDEDEFDAINVEEITEINNVK